MKSSLTATIFTLCLASLAGGIGCRTTETITDEFDFGSPSDGETSSIVDSKIKHYQEMVKDYPLRSDLYFKMAELYFQKDNYRAAEKALREALEVEPDNVKFLYQLGRAHLRMAEHKAAEEAFTRAITASGKRRYTGLHSALGFTLTLQKKWGEAREQFQACVELDPDSPAPYYFLGSIADIEGDPEQAIRYMTEYLERGGRYFTGRATEVLNRHGVVVEVSAATPERAKTEAIGAASLFAEDGAREVPASTPPGASELTPATGSQE